MCVIQLLRPSRRYFTKRGRCWRVVSMCTDVVIDFFQRSVQGLAIFDSASLSTRMHFSVRQGSLSSVDFTAKANFLSVQHRNLALPCWTRTQRASLGDHRLDQPRAWSIQLCRQLPARSYRTWPVLLQGVFVAAILGLSSHSRYLER